MAPERDKERRDVEGEEDSEKCGVMCGCQRVMAEVRTSDHEDSDVGHEATAVGSCRAKLQLGDRRLCGTGESGTMYGEEEREGETTSSEKGKLLRNLDF